jgi:hypothetical protein
MSYQSLHILDRSCIPKDLNRRYPPMIDLPIEKDDISRVIRDIIAKRFDISPVSVLNEIAQKLNTPRPRYTFFNDDKGLYMCKVTFSGYTFITSESRYQQNESKVDAANIALDNIDFESCRPSKGDMPGNKSPITLLCQLCERMGWDKPLFTYEGPAYGDGFSCSIYIDAHKGSIKFEGEMKFPKMKQAKEDSSKKLIEYLNSVAQKCIN